MKHLLKIGFCIVVLVVVLAIMLSGCGLSRKLKGVELKFQKKITEAEALSFDMLVTVIDADGTQQIDIGCYKQDDEYAYIFADPDNKQAVYRRLYADNKYYEFLQTGSLITAGTYYVQDNVSYTVDENILYAVTKYVMLASYATLISSGKKETLAGVETYRYDFNVSGNTYSLWYDDENLVQVEAIFRTEDGGNTTEETYRAAFSNYKFADVDRAPFARPDAGLYVESPIPMQAWMEIITKFSNKMSGWAK